jgi:hypothetical protein
VRGPAITEFTKAEFSTHDTANCPAVMPFFSACALISCASFSDSGRHSVCIMRVSLRPARVSLPGAASGAYLPVRTPRASGL